MDPAAFPELTELRTLVQGARLAADAEHSVLWCLNQLPKLEASQGTGAALVAQLGGLHERLGLAPLALKGAAPGGVRKKRPA